MILACNEMGQAMCVQHKYNVCLSVCLSVQEKCSRWCRQCCATCTIEAPIDIFISDWVLTCSRWRIKYSDDHKHALLNRRTITLEYHRKFKIVLATQFSLNICIFSITSFSAVRFYLIWHYISCVLLVTSQRLKRTTNMVFRILQENNGRDQKRNVGQSW